MVDGFASSGWVSAPPDELPPVVFCLGWLVDPPPVGVDFACDAFGSDAPSLDAQQLMAEYLQSETILHGKARCGGALTPSSLNSSMSAGGWRVLPTSNHSRSRHESR